MDAVSTMGTHRLRAMTFDVELASVATAVPKHTMPQADVEKRSRRFYPQFSHMADLYANTGVGTRYFCMPKSRKSSKSFL